MVDLRRFVLVSSVLAACQPTPTPTTAAEPAKVATSAPSPPAPPQPTTPEPPTPAATASATATDPNEKVPDIEYVPTPQNVVDKMLEVAKIGKNDVLYDLGCGDGRIMVTAAKKFGIKAMGFDVDPARIKDTNANIGKSKVESLVTVEQKDIFTLDLSPASVVTLYLLPELNVRLIPQLDKLKPGSRIVTHDFDMEGVEPEKTWTIMAPDHRPPYKNREHYVYLFKTPLRKIAHK